MNITPIIPDGYNGPIKQLTCHICKHLFYITQDDYRRFQEVRYCHECSLILLEELQNNQGVAALRPPTATKTAPVNSPPPRFSLQPSPPVRLPAPRTLDREKMTVEQVLDEAKMFEKTWRYREALHSYEEALQRDPRCIAALHGCASMLSILHRPREALVVYEELLRLEPASAKTLSRKGWTLGSLKRYEEAFAAFDAALQLDPSDKEASTGKWFFLTHLDRDEEAEQVRKSKTKRTPRHEDVTGPCSTADDYYQRGLALSALGRDEESILAYEECLRLDPLRLEVYERIHFIHLAKGRHEQSLATFTRAVQAFPECATLHIWRAEAFGRVKRYQEASEACQRAIQLDGAYPEAYVEKSRHLAHLQR
jgi:tetratricopeptide (TPR) repeat protein